MKWIEPIKSHLKHEPSIEYWRSKINSPEYFSWLGYAFESLCYKHISQIKRKLDIDTSALASPWRYIPRKGSSEKGVQIDLLLNGRDMITLFEIKHTLKPFVIDKHYAENLRRKVKVFISKTGVEKQVSLVMITSAGLKENDYSRELVDGVVTLEDLFE